LTYLVCFDCCTHWLHLPQVGNFDISDDMLCPKGVDFDFFFCKNVKFPPLARAPLPTS
jgi:hypothetical protein